MRSNGPVDILPQALEKLDAFQASDQRECHLQDSIIFDRQNWGYKKNRMSIVQSNCSGVAFNLLRSAPGSFRRAAICPSRPGSKAVPDVRFRS